MLKQAAVVVTFAFVALLSTTDFLSKSNAQPAPESASATGDETDMARFCRSRRNRTPPFYPRNAIDHQRAGAVTLDCSLDEDSQLAMCGIKQEIPANMGFGRAALRTACLRQISPPQASTASQHFYLSEEGKERVTFTVNFNVANR